MRRFLRILVVLVVVIAVAIGVLYVSFPAHVTPGEGAADPILGVRRPVVRWLREAGILAPPSWTLVLGGDPLLPTVGNRFSYLGEAIDPAWELRISREPVYRGILWPVGDRIAVEERWFHEHRSGLVALRLVYRESGDHAVAGEGTVENGSVDPEGGWAKVRGYVPRSADAYALEEIGADGSVRESHSWSRSR